MTKVLHILTRDLGLHDHQPLLALVKDTTVKSIQCCFYLNKEQLEPGESGTANIHAIGFMFECLEDLHEKLPNGIVILKGPGDFKPLLKYILDNEFTGVSITRDYTVFAKEREDLLEAFCKKKGLRFFIKDNYLLMLPDENSTMEYQEKVYKVFTPYYNLVKDFTLRVSRSFSLEKFTGKKVSMILPKAEINGRILHGGTTEALKRLAKVKKLGVTAGTKMSPYLKFGTISCRAFYNAVGPELQRSLWWREFYYRQYLYTDFAFGKNGKPKSTTARGYRNSWSWETLRVKHQFINSLVEKLKSTGFITNRERMALSSYVVYHTKFHWKVGEDLFRRFLIDYDPIQNLGGWLWNFKPTNKMNPDIQEKKILKEEKLEKF